MRCYIALRKGINIPWVAATTLLLIDSSRRGRGGMAELGTAYYPVDIPVCLAVILVLPAGMLTHSTTLCKPKR